MISAAIAYFGILAAATVVALTLFFGLRAVKLI
ncbi:MAG: cytochrome B6-F complex subunit VI (PetL) [Moorea sp. SIO1F2]|nr:MULTISPECIES: cytochrome b6-f complex subunit PetL [unclassified Moorena]NEO02726.1 cytochrome B6-F complex subunit VI (PetL) [Moorena sp. SIO3I7]NEO89905.1 cytochrome B6-F complex subunit VI (PetL) [Moorena sp. SIO3G5]NEO08024.1 cytochrome B6-F complex subunit VI (PetL) [Moorena sp. SIO3I8]NEO22779.1 cytochrome B6-F complex subunit VI (PetL) [Moorena sp. SIO4A5]NEP23607.1 cytochrome B6-F complex subunit VI (PetL) [Moorena sp. SIO3I6]